MGVANLDFDWGGSGCPDLRPDLLGGSTTGHALRFVVMGPNTTNEEGVGQITPQGGPQADREATT